MARITVPFSGLTSNANHKDGECSNLVNLRPKNGYLKPVSPRKEEYNFTREYDIVFLHRINELENWIGITHSVIYSYINTASPIQIGDTGEKINSVQQIGNTLSFVCDANIYYALWSDQYYKYLGNIPELPVVSFDTPAMELKSLKYTTEYDASPSFASDKISELYDYTRGLANVLIDRNKGKFCDAFLITYAFRLYDGSAIKHSSPMLVMPRESYKDWAIAYLPRPSSGDLYGPDSEVRLKMFMLNAAYDFSSLSLWKDVIKSVDFFVTKYVGLASPENLAAGFWSFMISDGLGEPPTYLHNMYYPVGGRNVSIDFKESVEDKVINTSQFYLYYSEDDFSGSKTTIFPNPKVTVKDDFYNIVHQEDMPDYSLSHHSIGAKTASIYNNRLRLSDITTSLYTGHPISQFKWGSPYNGEEVDTGTIMPGSVHTYVTLKTEQGEIIVRRYEGTAVLFLGAFISYPDPRATNIRIFETEASGYIKERFSVALTPHPRLNIAYAVNDGLKPFISNSDATTSGTPRYNFQAKLIENNKLKVSEVNNPFVFPDANTYQVGSGKILNESSIIMNVSDRNYGMYPMFVFTTDGVFTMAGQTSDSVHDSVQAPTYLEPPISDVICATPYGVAFITKRGLMLISQHETNFISSQLREEDDKIVIHDINEISEESVHYPNSSFVSFLSKVKSMLYNPYNDELIISSSDYDYSYVYDFPTQSFYLSTEKFTGIVQNSFPDIYVVDGQKIKDYSRSQTKAANVSIITRPLSFGTTDIKTLGRVWLRALLYNTTVMSVAAFHSLDGVNFFPIKGLMFGQRNGNYLDVDLGLLARQTYKHYMLIIAGTVGEDTQIRYSEYEVDKRYNNEKMR